jgi:hypothetical protein
MKLNCIVFKNVIPTSKEAHHFVTQIQQFKKAVSIYSDNQRKPTNILFEQNTKLLVVTTRHVHFHKELMTM